MFDDLLAVEFEELLVLPVPTVDGVVVAGLDAGVDVVVDVVEPPGVDEPGPVCDDDEFLLIEDKDLSKSSRILCP